MESGFTVYLIFSLIIDFLIVATSALHLWYMNHHVIQRRNPTIFMVSSLACLITVNFQIASYDPFYPFLPYPCFVRGLISVPISPLFAYCLLLRSMQLVYMNCISNIRLNSFRKFTKVETAVLWIYLVFNKTKDKKRAEETKEEYISTNHQDKGNSAVSKPVEDQESVKETVEPFRSSAAGTSLGGARSDPELAKQDPMKDKMAAVRGSKSDLRNVQNPAIIVDIGKPSNTDTSAMYSVTTVQSAFTQNQSAKSNKFVYGSVFRPWSIFKMCLVVFTVVFFISAILQTSNLDVAFESHCEMWVILPASITFAFFVLCMPFTLAVIKDIENDLGIKFELKLSMASFMICFPFYFAVAYFLPPDTPLRLGLGPSIYYTLPNAFSHLVCSLMPFRYILFRKKKLQGDRDALLNAMSNPEDFQQLKKIMAKDFCVENIMFYEDFNALKTKLNLCPANSCVFKVPENMTGQVQVGLKDLYEKYVARGSALELNVCLSVLNRLRRKSVNNKEFPIDLFEHINDSILETIYRHQFQQLLSGKKSKKNTAKGVVQVGVVN